MSQHDHPIIDPHQAQRASVRKGIAQFQARLQRLRVGELRRRADVLVRRRWGFAELKPHLDLCSRRLLKDPNAGRDLRAERASGLAHVVLGL